MSSQGSLEIDRRRRGSRSRLYGLPREAVVAGQRRRILDAVSRTHARFGYGDATIAQVVRLAGVSRPTFYELFPSWDDAFLAAHEEALAVLTARVSAAVGVARSWSDEVVAGISTALDLAAAEPLRALLLVESRAGPRGSYAYDALAARFAPSLARGRDQAPLELPDRLEETLLGGLTGVVASRLRQGQADSLVEHAPALARFVLTPYRP